MVTGKKYILLIFFIVHIPLCAFADRKTDSLMIIVHEYEKKAHFESDTNYIKALIAVAENLQNSQPDTSLLFSNKAYELSKNCEYPKGILNSSLSMAVLFIKEGDIQKLLQIAGEVLPIAEKIDRKSLSKVYNIFGSAYFIKGYSDKSYFIQAEEMFKKALKIAGEYNDTEREYVLLNNMANIYVGQYNYSSALEVYYKAVNTAEKSKININITPTLYNIAHIYELQNKFDKALAEIPKAIETAEKNEDIINLGKCLYLTGRIYKGLNKLDEALDYIDKSMKIFRQLDLTFQITEAKKIFIEIYVKKGLYDEALKIAHEVHETWKEIGDSRDIAYLKLTIADIHFNRKQYAATLKLCNEILDAGTDALGILNSVHSMMSQIYEDRGDGMKALEHFKLHKACSDSLFHNDLDEKIIQLEAQSKYEKKEMELKAEQELKEAGFIKDKARLQLIIAFVLVLFITMLVFLIVILRSRKKLKDAYGKLTYANAEIQQQKEEISAQSEELKATNEHLVKLIKFKQDISGMIVHDLKNPLSIMLGLTTTIPDERRLSLLHDSAQRMLNLVLNILDINKYEDSKLELKYTNTDINDLINSVSNDLNATLNFKKLNINLRLQDDLEFSFDKDIIRRVLDNILNNAIKFSPANETIYISTVRDEEDVRITVRNTGTAIPSDMQKVIFEPYERVERKENESSVKSTGLGLTFCKMAVTAHGGAIGVESLPGNPTDFWFTLPYRMQ